jgi:serine/threonine-protein kinase
MKFCPACESHYDDQPAYCPDDGRALIEDLIGVTVDGKYEIKEFIGCGGTGCVFRAEHLNLGGNVAIKVLPSSANGDVRHRFQREGHAIMRLNGHPNIVIVHDLISSGDLIYMVEEYLEGRNLGAEWKERSDQGRRFIPAEVLKILQPIACALDSAHAEGIIHRDVKPENVMIAQLEAPQPKVKLMDFGVAKFLNQTNDKELQLTLTPRNHLVGTYYYMSPEQWGVTPRDLDVEIDLRTDVYSLGVIAYQLASGRRPFEAQTANELYNQICSVTPDSLHEILPLVPEGFSRAVSRAMAKDREDRQASAGEFVRELRVSLGLPSADEVGQEAPAFVTPRQVEGRPDLAETVIDVPPDGGVAVREVINLAVEMSDGITNIYREGRHEVDVMS